MRHLSGFAKCVGQTNSVLGAEDISWAVISI